MERRRSGKGKRRQHVSSPVPVFNGSDFKHPWPMCDYPFASKLTDNEFHQLCVVCEGRPVFVPDPGFEYLWDKGWARHVASTVSTYPDIGRSIINKELPLDGRRLKSIQLHPLEHAAVNDVWRPHVLKEPACWRSYDCCWVDKSDFGSSLPKWATIRRDDFETLKQKYEFPELLYRYLDDNRDSAYYKSQGFYNQKHEYIHETIGG